jgi:uncharacterized cysteine cluster protein YcgN (CxxCxxCC family)
MVERTNAQIEARLFSTTFRNSRLGKRASEWQPESFGVTCGVCCAKKTDNIGVITSKKYRVVATAFAIPV